MLCEYPWSKWYITPHRYSW